MENFCNKLKINSIFVKKLLITSCCGMTAFGIIKSRKISFGIKYSFCFVKSDSTSKIYKNGRIFNNISSVFLKLELGNDNT